MPNSNTTEIDKISEDLKTENSPIILVDYLTKLAGWAAYFEGLLKPILMAKPNVWLLIQKYGHSYPINSDDELDKPLSDKKTEMTWATTEEGQKEIDYTSELKRIQLMSQAIRQNLWAKKIEYRNLEPNV